MHDIYLCMPVHMVGFIIEWYGAQITLHHAYEHNHEYFDSSCSCCELLHDACVVISVRHISVVF